MGTYLYEHLSVFRFHPYPQRKIHIKIHWPMNSDILGEAFIEWMAWFSANTENLLSTCLKKICMIAQSQSNWEVFLLALTCNPTIGTFFF